MAEEKSTEPVVIESEDILDAEVTEAEPINETVDEDLEPKTPQAKPNRLAGLVVMLLGGLLAGLIGFSISHWNLVAPSPNESQIEQLSSRLASLEAEIAQTQATSEAAQVERASLQDGISLQDKQFGALRSNLSEVELALEGLSSIQTRLSDLENRPIPDVGATRDAVDAYEKELTALREMFAAELETVRQAQKIAESRQSAALETESTLVQRAAIDRLDQAIAAGSSFAEPLAQLTELGLAFDPILAQHQTGVGTLAALQKDFPAASRELLQIDIQRSAQSGEIGRLEAFLRTQLGARSLVPREGDDADAVLARAEAHLLDGEVESAVAEVSGLETSATNLMQTWVTKAQAFSDVHAALAALRVTNN